MRGDLAAKVIAFVAVGGLLIAYALPGGAYDTVIRQEYGFVVWAVLGVGIAAGVLPRARPARPTAMLIGALIAYLVWTAFSLSWTESAERTTAEIARVLDYIGVVALLSAVLDRTTWRAAAAGLGSAALVVCAIALSSRLAPSAFGPNPLFSPQGNNRLSYPFGYWNAVGAWSAMATTLALAWSAHDESRVRRAFALGLVPVAGLVTYLSYSRAGVAGTVAGVVAVLALSRNRLTAWLNLVGVAVAIGIEILAVRRAPEIARGVGSAGAVPVLATIVLAVLMSAATALATSVPALSRARFPARLTRLFAVCGAVGLVVVAVSLGPRLIRKGWHQFSHPVVVTTTDPAARLTQLSGTRYDVWVVALDAFKTNPITGTGAGTFEFWWNRHARSFEAVRNAHSFELENLADLGVPGLVLIMTVMAAALATLVQVRQRCRRAASAGAATALLAAFIVYLLQASVDWLWESTAVTVFALAAAAIAGMRLSGGRPAVRWPVRAGVVLIALAAAAIQIPGLVSTTELRRSQAAERAGNGALALAWANAATSAEPWSASAYEQRGLVLEAGKELGPAAQALERAIARERTNYVHWLILARVETERGQITAAEADLSRARALRPKALVFRSVPVAVQRSPRARRG